MQALVFIPLSRRPGESFRPGKSPGCKKTLEIKGLSRAGSSRLILRCRGRRKDFQSVAFFVRAAIAIGEFAAHSEPKRVVPSLQAAPTAASGFFNPFPVLQGPDCLEEESL